MCSTWYIFQCSYLLILGSRLLCIRWYIDNLIRWYYYYLYCILEVSLLYRYIEKMTYPYIKNPYLGKEESVVTCQKIMDVYLGSLDLGLGKLCKIKLRSMIFWSTSSSYACWVEIHILEKNLGCFFILKIGPCQSRNLNQPWVICRSCIIKDCK